MPETSVLVGLGIACAGSVRKQSLIYPRNPRLRAASTRPNGEHMMGGSGRRLAAKSPTRGFIRSDLYTVHNRADGTPRPSRGFHFRGWRTWRKDQAAIPRTNGPSSTWSTRTARSARTGACRSRSWAASRRTRPPATTSSSRTARSPRNPASRRWRSRASAGSARSRRSTRKCRPPARAAPRNKNGPQSAGRFDSIPPRPRSVIQEAPQLPRPARMLQLAQRLRLDLADALARHRELLADLLQRVVGVHADAEAHAQHALLARGERGEHPRRGLAQVLLDRGVDRQNRVLVLDEIAEVRILLVADRGLERDRLVGDLEDLAHLLERHAELLGELLRRRLAADLVQHLAGRAYDLVDRLDHVHRNADGARLVGDRAGDRLADPPRRIGGVLVAAPVLELVDRLHQADVAFLDQVEELQAAVGVLLGDRDHETQVGLDHLLLRLARLALALLHHVHDLAELLDLESRLARQHVDVVAQVLNAVLVLGDEILPALGGELRHAVEPARVELGAEIVLEKILAGDAVALGEPHHAALVADQALVDVVELLDEAIDARLVEAQRLHLGDDLLFQLLVLALLRGRERGALEAELDVLLLQPAQALVLARHRVEGLQHLRLELGLDRGERERVLHVVLVHLAFAGGRCAVALLPAVHLVLRLERGRGGRRRRGRRDRRDRRGDGTARRVHAGAGFGARLGRRTRHHGRGRHRLGVGSRIGRLEIDDVAQEDLSLVELVAPDDDRLEGERALAQAGDHRLAAGLDTLGDRDLTLARQQLDRAHLAQIHPHWIVGALAGLGFLGLGDRLGWSLDELAVALFLLGLLGGLLLLVAVLLFLLDRVDAHLIEHRQDVLDLLGGHFLGWEHRVDLLIGDPAALLGELDHLLDGGVREVEQRQGRVGGGLRRLLLGRLVLLFFLGRFGLCRHRASPHSRQSHPPRRAHSNARHLAKPGHPCRRPNQQKILGDGAETRVNPGHPALGGQLQDQLQDQIQDLAPPAWARHAPPIREPQNSQVLQNSLAVPYRYDRLSKVAERPPGQNAKPFDRGLRSVDCRKAALHVAQPREILLARVIAQRPLGVLELPV